MPASIRSKTPVPSAASGAAPEAASHQPKTALPCADVTPPTPLGWDAPWQAQAAWAESYWQAWHTMAWMPWNMVLSAWQMADSHMPSTEPPSGLWHSALGQPKLGPKTPEKG